MLILNRQCMVVEQEYCGQIFLEIYETFIRCIFGQQERKCNLLNHHSLFIFQG